MDNFKNINEQIEANIKSAYATEKTHYVTVEKLKRNKSIFEIIAIVLTAISSCGLIATLFTNKRWETIVAAICSVLALCTNLYNRSRDYDKDINEHKSAGDELWAIRRSLESLQADAKDLKPEEIRDRRDKLINELSIAYQNFPCTSSRTYKKVTKRIAKEEAAKKK